MNSVDRNLAIRKQAYEYVEILRGVYEDSIPLDVLQEGFLYEGRKIVLAIRGRGIFKSKELTDEMPISILTTWKPPGVAPPYADVITEDGFFEYKYQGLDPNHYANKWLRRASETQTPLTYFIGVEKNQYLALSRVWIVGEDQLRKSFFLSPVPGIGLGAGPKGVLATERRFVAAMVKRRLHQARFRVDVLDAYSMSCAVCRLKHKRLLDAAHILPDTHPRGDPIVPNGLALCKLHHSAYDLNIMGVRPDLVIEVRGDVLEEVDGPMLVHGLQGFHKSSLSVPSADLLRPSIDRLEERYEAFLMAS